MLSLPIVTPNEQLDKKLKMSQHDERADQTKLTSEMSELWIPPLRFSEQCLHLWERYLTDMDEVDIIDQKLQSIGDKIVSLNPGLCWRIFLFVSKGKNEKVERLKEEEKTAPGGSQTHNLVIMGPTSLSKILNLNSLHHQLKYLLSTVFDYSTQ